MNASERSKLFRLLVENEASEAFTTELYLEVLGDNKIDASVSVEDGPIVCAHIRLNNNPRCSLPRFLDLAEKSLLFSRLRTHTFLFRLFRKTDIRFMIFAIPIRLRDYMMEPSKITRYQDFMQCFRLSLYGSQIKADYTNNKEGEILACFRKNYPFPSPNVDIEAIMATHDKNMKYDKYLRYFDYGVN